MEILTNTLLKEYNIFYKKNTREKEGEKDEKKKRKWNNSDCINSDNSTFINLSGNSNKLITRRKWINSKSYNS